jgi:transketolase
MRKQFVRTTEDVMAKDERLVVLLGDIGVFAFRSAFEHFPGRIHNIGICEQAMTSLAAGLSKEGLIPVVHSIAPFVVERCFEQIKVDFCYQKLGGNIVSVGGSYDYAALGGTHHCPGDVAVLRTLPGMEIVVPGTPQEYDQLFRAVYADGKPTYFRLSERKNPQSFDVKFGHARVLKQGRLATLVAVGTALAPTLAAAPDLDVTLLYYATVAPFDAETLRQNCASKKVALIEPYYEGVLVKDIVAALAPSAVQITTIGVPHRFLTDYGHQEEHDKAIGLTPENIRTRIMNLIEQEPAPAANSCA